MDVINESVPTKNPSGKVSVCTLYYYFSIANLVFSSYTELHCFLTI